MVEILRHSEIFNPDALNDSKTAFHIVGCGATGSKVARALADFGIEHVELWDFDIVESHNIANQEFRNKDIGKTKVSALAEIIKEKTGYNYIQHNDKVVDQRLDGYVFLLTDTMASRKEIFENCLKYKPNVKGVIETRMASDAGRIYTFSPLLPKHNEKWLKASDYGDDVAEVSHCGASISVGITASILANMAVWQFVKYYDANRGTGEFTEHEVIFQLRPTFFIMPASKFSNFNS